MTTFTSSGSLYKDVASDYLVEVNVSEQLPNAIDRTMRTAKARRAPTAIIIPADLQEEEEYSPPQHAFKHVPSSGPGASHPVVIPPEDELAHAAEIINAGEKVAILIGQGARNAVDEVKQLAEVPPIPPHATWEQIKSTTASVLKGDSNAWHMMVQGAKTKAQEFIPNRG